MGWQTGDPELAWEVTKTSGVWGPCRQRLSWKASRHQVWPKISPPHPPGGFSCTSPFPTPRGRLDQLGSGQENRALSPRSVSHHSDIVTELEELQRQAGNSDAEISLSKRKPTPTLGLEEQHKEVLPEPRSQGHPVGNKIKSFSGCRSQEHGDRLMSDSWGHRGDSYSTRQYHPSQRREEVPFSLSSS